MSGAVRGALLVRPLSEQDDAALHAFWAQEPHASLFAIPDLEHHGWHSPELRFLGWFEGGALVGYLMHYGISAQWSYCAEHEAQIAPAVAERLARYRPQFVTLAERVAGLKLLPF